jgi:hypothetical protein
MKVTTLLDTRLTWDYSISGQRITALYERAKTAQWNASTDIDWSQEVPFGAPLPEESTFGRHTFESSPLASRGKTAWDMFRWEFQNWMVSQFLHGEQGALIGSARLAEAMPDIDAKLYAASQAGDEARHVEAFSRYAEENIPQAYDISAPLASLIKDLLADSRWDITALGMQILIEALAMAAFRTANATFHDPLIKDITRLVARDEARHVSFGILALEKVYPEMTSYELRDREEFVLEAASLMRRRFLLEEVWERLDVPRDAGTEFAASNPVMIAYRQTIFAKVISALTHIGLMTDRTRAGLESLDLVGRAGSRLRSSY